MKLPFDLRKESEKVRLYKFIMDLKPVKYIVEVKQDRPSQTDPQRRYYFGVIVKVLAAELGYTKEEMHEVLKVKFNPHQKVLPTGEVFIIGETTKEWDIAEAAEKHEEIKRWAIQELDIYIPDPGEMIEA